MQDLQDANLNIRARATVGMAVAGTLGLMPFLINNFIQGRNALGIASIVVLTTLSISAFFILRGKFYLNINRFLLMPAVIAFLVICFYYQGIIGAFWCFPAVGVFYFLLPERNAWVLNFILLLVAMPIAFQLLDQSIALRFSVTLFLMSTFLAIFVRIVNKQQDKLKASEQLRKEGFASVSHELRTPLANMALQIEALQDGLKAPNTQNLGQLRRSVSQMDKLINDMYQLSLTDVEALAFHIQKVSLSQLVTDSIVSNQARLQKADIQVHFDPNTQVQVWADAIRLHQVLNNLIENACRYTKTGGSLWIRIEESQQGHLIIEDDGPGVSDAALSKLFDRFYREDKSRSRITGGSGLGLAIVKAIVEAQKGSIKAYHSQQGGLGIRISLPSTEPTLF